MGLFSPTALPWSFTLFKAFSASKSLLFGSRLLLVFVVWAAFLGGGLILAVISCIFAPCHLCQLAVFSLRHTSHTAFLIHLHPAAARRVSAVYECVFWREVCLLVRQGRAWIRASPYSWLAHSVNFNANGKGISWLWKNVQVVSLFTWNMLCVCVLCYLTPIWFTKKAHISRRPSEILFIGWILSERPADERWMMRCQRRRLNYDLVPPTCSRTHDWQLKNADSYQKSAVTDTDIKGHFGADMWQLELQYFNILEKSSIKASK